MDEKNILRGNETRVNPVKRIEGLYATNAVTMSRRKEGEAPLSEDENVVRSREFSRENKK